MPYWDNLAFFGKFFVQKKPNCPKNAILGQSGIGEISKKVSWSRGVAVYRNARGETGF